MAKKQLKKKQVTKARAQRASVTKTAVRKKAVRKKPVAKKRGVKQSVRKKPVTRKRSIQSKRSAPKKTKVTFAYKELMLVALVALVAGVSIYGVHMRRVAYAQQLPVITNFRADVLEDEAFLELDVFPQVLDAEQVEAVLLDEQVPAPVENLVAHNARIGNEVALFWDFPESVSMANVYRKMVGSLVESKAELIAEQITDDTFIDTAVEDDKRYEYQVFSVNVISDEIYQSIPVDSPTAMVTPLDQVPPRMPTEVTVVSVTDAGTYGLNITWVNPTDEDFDHVKVFRSSFYGNRGKEITKIDKADAAQYFDKNVKVNEKYYYTVIAYDNSSNASSDDFQLPEVGNSQPFEPFSAEFLVQLLGIDIETDEGQ